jgi:hypothetical protein
MATATETTPVRALDEHLRRLHKERDEIDARRAEVTTEIKRYERARKLLDSAPSKNGRKRRRKGLDAHTVAGPKALKQTEDLMKDNGELAQSEVVKQTGLNSGTVSYALRALEKDGVVRKTGEVVGRSPVWEFVSDGRSTKVPANS